MKKRFLIVGLLALCGVGFGLKASSSIVMSKAEDVEPVAECSVVLPKLDHAKISADILEGSVGEIVTLTISPDFLYVTKAVAVNGVFLSESATTRGEYSFALAKGVNTVAAEITIDQEQLGVFSTMVDQAVNKDWKSFFSVENVTTIVKWVFDCGILIAVIRYFIKDKKLAEKVESATKETIEKLIPEQTKVAVEKAVVDVITPLLSQITANEAETQRAYKTFAKCMALSQENTPEARRAILDELSKLDCSDNAAIEATKKYIEELVANSQKQYEETMKKLNEISESNKEIAGIEKEKESVTETVEESSYDGTSI